MAVYFVAFPHKSGQFSYGDSNRNSLRRAETNITITRLESEIVTLELDTTELQTELAELEQRCLDAGVGTGGTADDSDAPRALTLSLLHADHLGRPIFATDIDGATIWDGGITTPFGVQVSTMGAITQSLHPPPFILLTVGGRLLSPANTPTRRRDYPTIGTEPMTQH